MMQYTDLASFKYFFLSLLIYLLRVVGLLMFCITLHFLRLLACLLLAHTPVEPLRPSVHPAQVMSHLQILQKHATGCRVQKKKNHLFTETLWPPSASTFTHTFSTQKKLTRQDVPESFSSSPGSLSRRWLEGFSVAQVSVELRLHCFPSSVCQRAGVSTSCPAAAAESLNGNLFCSAVWATPAKNVHSQTVWIAHQSCI